MACLDSFNRSISYLRVSVTDRCNLRCVYCMPPEGVPWVPHENILRYEEIVRVVRIGTEMGITKVRLTGGEPLVRAGIVSLVAMIAAIPGVDDLAMTTNGVLLAHYAEDLAKAGLDRVNVSLDTLRPERFRAITRLGDLADVERGLAAARAAGLEPVKVNTVLLRGVNDDEIVDFARRTLREPFHVRFIEAMPVGPAAQARFLPVVEARERIEAAFGPLEVAHQRAGNGPASYYRIPGACGTVGFISAISEHFCHQCNRLRLTADGRLRPCLLSDAEVPLREALRSGVSDAELKQILLTAVAAKPEGHHLNEGVAVSGRGMSQIGG
ncbi:MAG: GTP 3',8-cyclase MoaA [Chloroflexi bacterium]|nr:GTP 3',8-cyclase MoaA [Chloroflexota bacterium]